MKTVQKGFTLIELMIVVAIIGILAAIAIPAYQDYTQRAQVSEAFTLISGAKSALAEFAQTNGAYPTTAQLTSDLNLGGTIAGKYSSYVVGNANGEITVTMNATGVGNAVKGKKVKFAPPTAAALDAGTVQVFNFTCTSVDLPKKYLPSSCAAPAP